MKFVCFQLESSYIFSENSRMTKISRNRIFKGNNFIFQVKAFLKLTTVKSGEFLIVLVLCIFTRTWKHNFEDLVDSQL